jgi:Fe-S cluster assembly protein SufD
VSVQTYLDDFETFAGERHPEWLGLLRRGAIERFRALGFPTTRHEDWHFTSVAPIADAEFVPLRSGGGDVQAADLDQFLVLQLEHRRDVAVVDLHETQAADLADLFQQAADRLEVDHVARGAVSEEVLAARDD